MEFVSTGNSRLKVTVGLGSIDEYCLYAEAGADELFCGYVPESWMSGPGLARPLNRREVMYYHVQLGSRSELEILREMVRRHGVPVTIALNALSYEPEDYSLLLKIIEECMDLGFERFIAADPVLLLALEQLPAERKKRLQIHVSGEMSEINHEMVSMWNRSYVARFIFHRNTLLSDMKAIISCGAEGQLGLKSQPDPQDQPDIKGKQGVQAQKGGCSSRTMEYEAFVLNERCQFHGAYCNSLHCDELQHICRVPYRLEKREGNGKLEETLLLQESRDCYLTGESGCGLCALWSMREAGVTHVKLVSRGNYIEDTLKDIGALKRAIELLEQSQSEKEYKMRIKSELFVEKCSGNCYYWKQNTDKQT